MAARYRRRKWNTNRVVLLIAIVLLLAGLAVVGVVSLLKPSATPSGNPSSAPSTTTSVLTTTTTKPDNRILPISTATIVNTGDILIHSPILDNVPMVNGEHSFDKIFSVVAPYIQKSDYATINLELSLPGSNYSGYPRFRTPDTLIDSLLLHGFDMVTIANNHLNDSGSSGFMRTMQVLLEKNMAFIGARQTAEDKRYRIVEINGIRVGMFNYTYGTLTNDGRKALNGLACSKATSELVNMFNMSDQESAYPEMQEIVGEMKADGAEVIVAYMHWGYEYWLKPSGYQTQMAQALCDMGVDVIVGGHPHKVQPADVLTSEKSGKTTLCLYSMGNAVSNQRTEAMSKEKTGHTEDGVLFSFTFTKYTDGSVRVTAADILPTWVHLFREDGKKVYQIVPLDKTVENWGEAFGLNKTAKGVQDAEESYERTMALVRDGLKEYEAFFARQQAELDDFNAHAND